MLEEPLRILQLNVGKQKETQWSLLNDTDTARFDVLVVAEPYIFTLSGESKARVTSHHQWEAITPTVQRKEGHVRHSFRAMLWLNKNTQGQAIPIQLSDIAAVLIRSQGVPVLIFSVYIPRGGKTVYDHEDQLKERLQILEETIEQVKKIEGEALQVIVASDVNRRDQLWGGDQVAIDLRQGEAKELLNLIQRRELQSLLEPGTIT